MCLCSMAECLTLSSKDVESTTPQTSCIIKGEILDTMSVFQETPSTGRHSSAHLGKSSLALTSTFTAPSYSCNSGSESMLAAQDFSSINGSARDVTSGPGRAAVLDDSDSTASLRTVSRNPTSMASAVELHERQVPTSSQPPVRLRAFFSGTDHSPHRASTTS